jgi:hypothetical protein
MTDLMRYLLQWMDHPGGGRYFPNLREQIRSHGDECASLVYAWLPRKGGYSCLSDSMTCDGCDIAFFWEGLYQAFENCPKSNHYYCACCLASTKVCSCASEKEKVV